MLTYTVKLTWCDRDGNAVCAGLDETVHIAADSPVNAAHQAQCDAMDANDDYVRETGNLPAAEVIGMKASTGDE